MAFSPAKAVPRLMFAKKPQAAPAVAAPKAGLGARLNPIANPYLGAGGASVLFLASAIALVMVLGDPQAGAPKLRIPLDAPSNGKGALGLRSFTSPNSPLEGGTLDNLAPGQDVGLGGFPEAGVVDAGPLTGEAVITLPQGGSMGAGKPLIRPGAEPLPQAPIAGLSAPGPGGPLPIIAADGRTPFQAYARPFKDGNKPRVAVVVGGLGLNAVSTRAAIEILPPEVTLSFVPYADGLQGWVDLARASGHEVMLELPMEPLDYPDNDPGPQTLMASGSPQDTTRKLEWLLSRTTGYFAVTNYLGGKFITSDKAMTGLMSALRNRGLGFLDDGSARNRSGGGAPRASATSVIDEQLSSEAIDKQLNQLEAQALQRGQALGAGFAYPVTVEAVARWARGLANRGYQLAPASALARK